MSWARWIGFHSLVVDAATQQHWYVATYLFRNGWPSVEFAAYEKDTFSSFAHGNLFWMTYDSERTCLETHFHSAYEKRSEVTWH